MMMIFPYLVLVRNPRWLQEDEQSDQSPHSDSEQSTVSSPCRIDTVNFISLFMDKIVQVAGIFYHLERSCERRLLRNVHLPILSGPTIDVGVTKRSLHAPD